jgi:hypothetical protein
VPNQDLCVTKAHSLYIDGVLIPVEFLVNQVSSASCPRKAARACTEIEEDPFRYNATTRMPGGVGGAAP